jgi:hypothetical protein
VKILPMLGLVDVAVATVFGKNVPRSINAGSETSRSDRTASSTVLDLRQSTSTNKTFGRGFGGMI